MPAKGNRVFLAEGFANMRLVGAIAPTSRFVARAIAAEIGADGAPRTIVELGVGVGNITEEIVKRMRKGDRLIGIDANEKLVEVCKKNIAKYAEGLLVDIECADARHLQDVLVKYHAAPVDAVVCTIPFRLLPKRDTERIMREIEHIVKPGGSFIFIRYIHAPATKEVFDGLKRFAVVKKKTVLRNIPPTEVVIMRKHG